MNIELIKIGKTFHSDTWVEVSKLLKCDRNASTEGYTYRRSTNSCRGRGENSLFAVSILPVEAAISSNKETSKKIFDVLVGRRQ